MVGSTVYNITPSYSGSSGSSSSATGSVSGTPVASRPSLPASSGAGVYNITPTYTPTSSYTPVYETTGSYVAPSAPVAAAPRAGVSQVVPVAAPVPAPAPAPKPSLVTYVPTAKPTPEAFKPVVSPEAAAKISVSKAEYVVPVPTISEISPSFTPVVPIKSFAQLPDISVSQVVSTLGASKLGIGGLGDLPASALVAEAKAKFPTPVVVPEQITLPNAFTAPPSSGDYFAVRTMVYTDPKTGQIVSPTDKQAVKYANTVYKTFYYKDPVSARDAAKQFVSQYQTFAEVFGHELSKGPGALASQVHESYAGTLTPTSQPSNAIKLVYKNNTGGEVTQWLSASTTRDELASYAASIAQTGGKVLKFEVPKELSSKFDVVSLNKSVPLYEQNSKAINGFFNKYGILNLDAATPIAVSDLGLQFDPVSGILRPTPEALAATKAAKVQAPPENLWTTLKGKAVDLYNYLIKSDNMILKEQGLVIDTKVPYSGVSWNPVVTLGWVADFERSEDKVNWRPTKIEYVPTAKGQMAATDIAFTLSRGGVDTVKSFVSTEQPGGISPTSYLKFALDNAAPWSQQELSANRDVVATLASIDSLRGSVTGLYGSSYVDDCVKQMEAKGGSGASVEDKAIYDVYHNTVINQNFADKVYVAGKFFASDLTDNEVANVILFPLLTFDLPVGKAASAVKAVAKSERIFDVLKGAEVVGKIPVSFPGESFTVGGHLGVISDAAKLGDPTRLVAVPTKTPDTTVSHIVQKALSVADDEDFRVPLVVEHVDEITGAKVTSLAAPVQTPTAVNIVQETAYFAKKDPSISFSAIAEIRSEAPEVFPTILKVASDSGVVDPGDIKAVSSLLSEADNQLDNLAVKYVDHITVNANTPDDAALLISASEVVIGPNKIKSLVERAALQGVDTSTVVNGIEALNRIKKEAAPSISATVSPSFIKPLTHVSPDDLGTITPMMDSVGITNWNKFVRALEDNPGLTGGKFPDVGVVASLTDDELSAISRSLPDLVVPDASQIDKWIIRAKNNTSSLGVPLEKSLADIISSNGLKKVTPDDVKSLMKRSDETGMSLVEAIRDYIKPDPFEVQRVLQTARRVASDVQTSVVSPLVEMMELGESAARAKPPVTKTSRFTILEDGLPVTKEIQVVASDVDWPKWDSFMKGGGVNDWMSGAIGKQNALISDLQKTEFFKKLTPEEQSALVANIKKLYTGPQTAEDWEKYKQAVWWAKGPSDTRAINWRTVRSQSKSYIDYNELGRLLKDAPEDIIRRIEDESDFILPDKVFDIGAIKSVQDEAADALKSLDGPGPTIAEKARRGEPLTKDELEFVTRDVGTVKLYVDAQRGPTPDLVKSFKEILMDNPNLPSAERKSLVDKFLTGPILRPVTEIKPAIVEMAVPGGRRLSPQLSEEIKLSAFTTPEEASKFGTLWDSMIRESDDFKSLDQSTQRVVDDLLKAADRGDVTSLIAHADDFDRISVTVREWTVSSVDAKMIGKTGMVSPYTVDRALDDLANLDWSSAAKKLYGTTPSGRSVLPSYSGSLKNIDKVSVRSIGEAVAYGLDPSVANGLKALRKEVALKRLDDIGLGDAARRLDSGQNVSSDELMKLFDQRRLVQDALWKEGDDIGSSLKIFNAVVDDVTFRPSSSAEREMVRNAIEEEKKLCKEVAPITGGCK